MKLLESGGLNADWRCGQPVRSAGKGCLETDCRGFSLHLTGDGSVVWPNREGERFLLRDVYPALTAGGCRDSGISLSWPATASLQAFLVCSPGGDGFLLYAPPEREGRAAVLTVTAESAGEVVISWSGGLSRWYSLAFRTVEDLPSLLAQSPVPVIRGNALPEGSASELRQFQLGFIGPDGRSSVPAEKGFHTAVDVADEILRRGLGEPGDILHFFGYGEGHDRGYPDYTPSRMLGGSEGMRSAIAEVRDRGFRVSCYLNGRIADREALTGYPELADAVLRDTAGRPLTEEYYGRVFHVMDPSRDSWLAILEEQALMLRRLGADIVQLDQLAGRAAAVPAGEIWGEGYRNLILRLRSAGLRIWIQGVSDYYPADWFEMTWRDLNILPGGILRGGNPFGTTDIRLLMLLTSCRTFLVPTAKRSFLASRPLRVIRDVLGTGGRLPLFGEEYLKELASLPALIE